MYDDLRALRRLHLLRAKIAREEGDAMAVLKACGNIEHAEPLETFDIRAVDLIQGVVWDLLVNQILEGAFSAV